MPRPRFTKLPKERRQEILDCAGREFAEHGYDGASLNGILAAAELSKGAFYYYFDDKADLFVTVFRELVEDLYDKIDLNPDALTAENYWPTLTGLAEEMLRIVDGKPWIMGVAKALYQAPKDLWEDSHFADYFAEQTQILSGLVVRGQELGVIRDDMSPGLIVHLWVAMDKAFDSWFVAHVDELDDPDARNALYQVGVNVMKRLTMPAAMLAKELAR